MKKGSELQIVLNIQEFEPINWSPFLGPCQIIYACCSPKGFSNIWLALYICKSSNKNFYGRVSAEKLDSS